MKLYLIGLPGSGKSFLGKNLAAEMNLPFIDLDQVIEQEAGMTVRKIFSEKGEDYFRNLEAVALRQQSKAPEFIMACGGGTPCFHENMMFINESGKSIFISLPVKEIVKRLSETEKEARPLLADADPDKLEAKLHELLQNRISFYQQASQTLTGNISTTEALHLLKS